MGWTSYQATCYKNGKIDRKAECDSIYNSDMVGGANNEVIGKFTVLKSVMVGSVYYAAVQKTKFATAEEPETSKVFAGICLTSVNNKDYDNFSYKDMDESCGPCYCDCPASILNLLTTTESKFAIEWRKECWETIEKKKMKRINPDSLKNLPLGSVIEMPHWDGGVRKLVKRSYHSPKTIWTDGHFRYTPKTIETQGYSIIKRGY